MGSKLTKRQRETLAAVVANAERTIVTPAEYEAASPFQREKYRTGLDAPTLPSVAMLRAEAQKADDAFGAALRREFGARAGDARYWHDGMYSFATRVLAGAKRAADERVRAAIEEGRA